MNGIGIGTILDVVIILALFIGVVCGINGGLTRFIGGFTWLIALGVAGVGAYMITKPEWQGSFDAVVGIFEGFGLTGLDAQTQKILVMASVAVVLFIAAFILIKIVGRLITEVVYNVGILNFFDKLIGLVIGVAIPLAVAFAAIVLSKAGIASISDTLADLIQQTTVIKFIADKLNDFAIVEPVVNIVKDLLASVKLPF